MKKLLACASFAALVPATSSAVPTTYAYTGAPYSTISGDDPVFPGSYDTTMQITGFVTLVDAIPPNTNLFINFTDDDKLVMFMGFNDGLIERNHAFGNYHFSTDATGGIQYWDVFVFGSIDVSGVNSFGRILSRSFCLPICDEAELSSFVGSSQIGERAFNTVPGAWTVTPGVPEPSTYALILASLGLVGFAAHRARKLHPQG